MTDKVFEQICAIKDSGLVNMCSVKEVFELALKMGFDETADLIFASTDAYMHLILTGERE